MGHTNFPYPILYIYGERTLGVIDSGIIARCLGLSQIHPCGVLATLPLHSTFYSRHGRAAPDFPFLFSFFLVRFYSPGLNGLITKKLFSREKLLDTHFAF